jgi:hypothetical protein
LGRRQATGLAVGLRTGFPLVQKQKLYIRGNDLSQLTMTVVLP